MKIHVVNVKILNLQVLSHNPFSACESQTIHVYCLCNYFMASCRKMKSRYSSLRKSLSKSPNTNITNLGLIHKCKKVLYPFIKHVPTTYEWE